MSNIGIVELNRCVMQGEIIALDPCRYTPYGLKLQEGRIQHRSEQQIEDSQKISCYCELSFVVFEHVLDTITPLSLGMKITFSGFLILRKRSLVLRVQKAAVHTG